MATPRPRLLILLCFLALLLEGCPLAWRRITLNEVIHPEDVTFITPGRTTLAEVVKRLGPPDTIRAVDGGTVIRYHFLDVKYFTVNVTRPRPFIFPVMQLVPNDLYQLTFSGGGSGTEELQIEFDRNWLAIYYAFAHHQQASSYTP